MNERNDHPPILLHHDGELADVAELLQQLGGEVYEQLGDPSWPYEDPSWNIIVATPRRILCFEPPHSGSRPMLIGISDGDSRTLQTQMKRMAVDLMVRRPVHPTALRLLMLHALYRGPERRRRNRVSVGSEIKFRSRLFPRRATLTELSTRGCRLLCSKPVEPDKKIKLTIPARATRDKPIHLLGRVARTGPATDDEAGLFVMAIRFENVSAELARRLSQMVEAYRKGPAALERTTMRETEKLQRNPRKVSRLRLSDDSSPAPVEEPVPNEPEERATHEDRRGAARHSYNQRIVALGEAATRVLLGRDISPGGMRVGVHPDLAVGDVLQLALHGAAQEEPTVIRAHVERDESDAGLVLLFDDLDERQHAAIAQLIEDLPLTGPELANEQGSGMVITEIIEQQTA